MTKYFVVGGGFAGLLVGKILRAQGKEFVGLEKSPRLGGETEVGHHRICARESIDFLKKYFPIFEWCEVEEPPHERKKGEWHALKENFMAEESFYLRSPFFHPKMTDSDFVGILSSEIGRDFLLNKSVVEITPEKKQIICQDGSQYDYEKIIWCSPIESLIKIWSGDKTLLIKQLKNRKAGSGGISLELEVSGALFPFQNTVVFPFRYKDARLRALGINAISPSPSSEHRVIYWVLFLEREITDDREELAKCIRTFKRELQKEFPELKASILSEKIVYLSTIHGENPTPLSSLNLLPDVFYVGSQARLKDTDEGLQNLDRTLNNCSQFEKVLATSPTH